MEESILETQGCTCLIKKLKGRRKLQDSKIIIGHCDLKRAFIQSPLLSIPTGVDNLNFCHCSGSTLWKVMDLSNVIFHRLLNVIKTKNCLS